MSTKNILDLDCLQIARVHDIQLKSQLNTWTFGFNLSERMSIMQKAKTEKRLVRHQECG